MSLYYTQKLLFNLNRDEALQARFFDEADAVLEDYKLTQEEIAALKKPDIGLLYILGVNGQLLMHYAAMWGYEWADYIAAMREALQKHGNVRAGLYVSVGSKGAL